ncbi:MAG TPA: urate oxidase, partial [Nocardioidaceae bacterium]|nr:urate oxidase [Nocardioidaceae bacterium]
RDLNVSSALRGRFEDAHTVGDQKDVLPTDTQKNTAFAFAKEHGVGAIEAYALTLGRHFVETVPAAEGARVEVEEYPWERIGDHSFVRAGGGVRTTVVDVTQAGATVVSGIKDLVVMNTTGSEFHGFLKDKYTTLAETHDRILATSLVATWEYVGTYVDWDTSYSSIKAVMLERFVGIHSLALQQTLYGMGEAVLEKHPEVSKISFSAPNKHHFLVDLSPFGVENNGEVFIAADRPYGLIEATVVRD